MMQMFWGQEAAVWVGTTITNFSARRQFVNVCVHAFPPSGIVLLNTQLWFGLETLQPSFLFIGCHDILLHISSSRQL